MKEQYQAIFEEIEAIFEEQGVEVDNAFIGELALLELSNR